MKMENIVSTIYSTKIFRLNIGVEFIKSIIQSTKDKIIL